MQGKANSLPVVLSLGSSGDICYWQPRPVPEPQHFPVHAVFPAEAARSCTECPMGATWPLRGGVPCHPPVTSLHPFQVVNRLGLDSLTPFDPKERIIE